MPISKFYTLKYLILEKRAGRFMDLTKDSGGHMIRSGLNKVKLWAVKLARPVDNVVH